MSFFGSSSPSNKWPTDIPMSSCQRSKRRNPIPFAPSDGSLQVLPTPVTQRQVSSANALQFGFVEKWESLKTYVKRTLAAPSVLVDSVVADVNVVSPINPRKDEERLINNADEVDEVVVDRSWSEYSETETNSDAAETASSRHDPSEHDADTIDVRPEGFWALPPVAFVRTRVWPVVAQFYRPRFEEAEELLYQKEVWGQGKRPSLWASIFFIASWALACATIQKPIVLADKIFFFGVAPLLTIPILFMCAYNFPYERPFFFQAFLCVSTWAWPLYDVLFAFLCGFYLPHDQKFTCGKKDFLSTFYYTSALQAVALFGTSLKRLPATIGALAFLIFSCATIIPVQRSYGPNLVNFVIFECVLLYMHSQKEQSSRKLFWFRQQLRVQFQRTRKAQVAERQAADSKRRLTSYVFHEVRVPLNTALLAVQNMASRPIAKDHEVEFSALEGSLSMMSKVLNDVLDFNRMDSGRLESLSRPYAFHKVLRSLFIPLRLAADARQLEFVTDLDMRIDEVARRAAYQCMDASPEVIAQHMLDQPSGERVMGMVVGDEMRLRQIITNLASNACKFTAAGRVTIRTRLVIPASGPPPGIPPPVRPVSASLKPTEGQSLTTTALSMHNEATSMHNGATPGEVERIVVRIEVTDTGSGIPPKDMVECKLFSAFNQTEQGRQQGGKGTGLGLALVRQIVKLSGGRLGLHSKVGQGSTFWVELPLGVGRKAMMSGPGTPSSLAHGAPAYPAPGDGGNGVVHSGSPNSGSSVTEAVDAAALAAAQAPPPTIRSSSALHGLMDQGGRFELILAKYDSHSPAPTRTLGDASTGTDYPLPPLILDTRQESGRTIRAARPTYVPMPSPPSFTLDGPPPILTPTQTLTPPLTAATPGGLRVLVVDDDALTRMLMTRMLERMGCRVATAENGEVALQRIVGIQSPTQSVARTEIEPAPAESRFAVIFLDNQMPKLSGVKLVERLRSLGRTDFVVGVTGNALLTDQKEYLDAGADHVLTKPVLEASLRSMLALAAAREKTLECEGVL